MFFKNAMKIVLIHRGFCEAEVKFVHRIGFLKQSCFLRHHSLCLEGWEVCRGNQH